MSAFEKVFCEAEERALGFLKTQYPFRVINRFISATPASMAFGGVVTYAETLSLFRPKSKRRFVTLSIAPLRLELDLDIGRGQDRYSIYELHHLEGSGPFPDRTHDLYQAMHDASQLSNEFERLAMVLQDCGKRFFANDPGLWTDLKNQRASLAQKQEREQMNSDAEKAFKEKNWQKVVHILEEHQADLSELARARLNYARKQIK
jgi:hypothetical protein